MRFLESVDGHVHLADPRPHEHLDSRLVDQVAIREHHRLILDAFAIAPADEFFGKVFDNVKRKRRVSSIPLDEHPLEGPLVIPCFHEFKRCVNGALVHLALYGVMAELVAIGAPQVAGVCGCQDEVKVALVLACRLECGLLRGQLFFGRQIGEEPVFLHLDRKLAFA